MTLLINAANLVFVACAFTTDILRLRVLSVAGTALALAGFASQPEPLVAVVAWNALFLLLNLAQLARLVAARRHAALPG